MGDGDSVSDVGADHGDVVAHSLRCLAADDTRFVLGDTAGDPVEVQGKERLTYEGVESTVRYVTSADQLPDCEALETYDDAYFETHALILVTQSVTSGSVDVSIKAIQKTETGYGVVLSYGEPGKDQVGK